MVIISHGGADLRAVLRLAHQFPRRREQIQGPAKVRLREARQRLVDRNEAGSGGFDQNTQRASKLAWISLASSIAYHSPRSNPPIHARQEDRRRVAPQSKREAVRSTGQRRLAFVCGATRRGRCLESILWRIAAAAGIRSRSR